MSWELDKKVITEKYFELININNIQLFGDIKPHLTDLQPVMPIVGFIMNRFSTITELIVKNNLWDAEIILRSALETLIKLLFITSVSGEEREQRIEEYWESLREINELKLSNQAKKNLEHFGDSEIHRVAYLPLILDDNIERELREKWPKPKRQKLEQKWSFSQMIMSISKNYMGKPLEILTTLSHSYRISSHVMHGDETGIGIINERKNRSKEEQEKGNSGHYLRLMSDCLTYQTMLSYELMLFLKLEEKTKFYFNNHNKINELEALISKYSGRVFDDTDYDKYRSK